MLIRSLFQKALLGLHQRASAFSVIPQTRSHAISVTSCFTSITCESMPDDTSVSRHASPPQPRSHVDHLRVPISLPHAVLRIQWGLSISRCSVRVAGLESVLYLPRHITSLESHMVISTSSSSLRDLKMIYIKASPRRRLPTGGQRFGEGRREVNVKLSSLLKAARGQERQPLGKSRVITSSVGQCFILEFHKQPFF